jgi:polysaccharide export outer membrane protein
MVQPEVQTGEGEAPTLEEAAAVVAADEQPVAPGPNEDETVYTLGPEDVIHVLVWKDETLTRTVTVRPDGKISLPLIGELQAAGLTPKDLSLSIRSGLQKYYKEQPEVSVIVTEINSVSVFILGQVALPGKHLLRRETTVLQMLSLAGGFREYADTKRIILLRREGSTETRIPINYKKLVSGESPDDNLILKSGDTLIVP